MYLLDYQGLMEAQALSTRAGIRMTCLDLELPHWDEVHKRDRTYRMFCNRLEGRYEPTRLLMQTKKHNYKCYQQK